jgi:DNA-binding transcriptional ArsR family regulator
MNEHEVRIAAYGLKLSPAVKLVLIGIISRVNWKTWTGEISFRDLAQRMNVSASSVRSSLKKLNEAGLITIKHNTTTTTNGKNIFKRSTVTVDVKSILGVSQIDTPPLPRIDTALYQNTAHPVSRIDTPPLPRIDTLTIEDNNHKTINNTIEDQQRARAEREKKMRLAQKRMKRTYR